MRQHQSLLKRILLDGEVGFEPRTETYILGLPGDQSIYDLGDGFPQMTTKNVPIRLPGEELFWKMRGERDVKPLFDRNVHIWDANAFDHWIKRRGLEKEFPKHTQEWEDKFLNYKEALKRGGEEIRDIGDLGPVYGFQWRHGFKRLRGEIDQLKNVVEGLKKNPISRYHLMTAWNPSDLPDQALGPCPIIHQFSFFDKKLHLTVYQRSCDVYLGVPFNISQDSLMLAMMAKETGKEKGKFVHSYGNVHIYLGVKPRANFWTDEKNVKEFRSRLKGVGKDRAKYLELKKWYEQEVEPEGELHERKDHVPFVLEQLSKAPRQLPSLELEDIGLFDAIERPLGEVAKLNSYNPHKWDSRATMAV